MPFDLISGNFIPEKCNIWRDCVDGFYDWVKEHIQEGAPLNESDHCGDPPLLLAAGNGHLTCAKLLLEEGADIEQRNVWGHGQGDNTPLHWAAMRGHVEIVSLLLKHHADATLRNAQGKMPIDLCQPCWSEAYRYTQDILAAC